MKPYKPPQTKQPITLRLNANESSPSVAATSNEFDPSMVSRYPDFSSLRQRLGTYLQVDPQRIVITAGGDEGIDRVMRWALRGTRREVLTHTPSFQMVGVYCHNSGGQLKEIEWRQGEFPTESFLNSISEQTGLVVLVSPNNPTGQVIPIRQQQAMVRAAHEQGAWALVDLAYVEFADDDPTADLAELPGVIMVRTFSKAWGLAGLRVGYLIAPTPDMAAQLQQFSGPFPVSGPSLALAEAALERGGQKMQQNVDATRWRRQQLTADIRACGGEAIESQANFVLARWPRAEQIWRALGERGIAVRWFGDQFGMTSDWLRITCPATDRDLEQLRMAMAGATDTPTSKLSQFVNQLPVQSVPANVNQRVAEYERTTRETSIRLEVNLDGTGKADIATGLGFLDHLLTSLSCHSRIDIELNCQGDLHVDDHHTVEDCALALGHALDRALGARVGIERFGSAYAPLDESLARTVIDLSG
ncbi:MAG TPA: aminotransferase class I/II-fold pyridoxal phosphate-dependent enzyme, partial [Pirellulaceae bacterium]|nr:aminotransferase class I/II-fold pyridoxal phosphate-dependent enzyme [Pirellulaceae bacterium]